MKARACLWILFVVWLLLVPGCLPIPQVQQDLNLPETSYYTNPDLVSTEYLNVRGFQEINTPEKYNQSYYLRYHQSTNQADTIVVLMPGIYGGATSLDVIARQIVASNINTEVWAVDRRANTLEDRSYMQKTLSTKDPSYAVEYYIENLNQENGFNVIPPDTLHFVGFWGLEVHLRDLHEIILKAEQEADTIILGGHSLGAAISGYYAAFDFGFTQADPGYQHIDGLFLLDGALGRTGGFNREPEGIGLGPLELFPGIESLREGSSSPYLTVGLTPANFAKREVLSLLATLEPDELSPEIISKFPITNRAALGINEDDKYGPSTTFSSSWGEVINAEFAGNLLPFLLTGTDALTSRTVIGVSEGQDSVDWSRGDPSIEHSSIDQLAKAWSYPETNRSEWYFPTRFALDIGAQEISLENAKGFVPNNEVMTATLAIGAGRGLVKDVSNFSAYQNVRPGSPFSTYLLPRFTHFDIVQAEQNPAVTLFNLWLERLN